jgi:hypothetical protein
MASPFRYFRKHTKVFLAVAAVLAIFIFVVGDAITRGGGSSGGAGDVTQTVATWNGGKLNAGQLGSLVAQRMLTDKFLRQLFVQGGGRSEYDFPTSVPTLLLSQQQADQIETEVIGMQVISSLAEQAGMSVSDALINHYIEEMGLNKVSRDEVVGILDNLGQGNAQANESIVFNTLRKMLLAYFYRRSYADASLVVLPQERWDDWRKVNERISVEAAVLPVEKFIGEVPEPTDAQLRAFYNDYKDADPNRYFTVGGRDLPSHEPGFAEPRRVRLQYLMASVAGRADQFLEKVTEEEIKQYYEDNKVDFIRMGLPGDDAFGTPETDAPATETPQTPAAEQPAAESATAPTTDSGAGDEQPAEETSSVDAQGESPAAGEGATTEEPAATTETTTPADSAEPAAPADATPPADKAGEESSDARLRSPFRLVAFQEEAAKSGDETPAAEEPATETPAAESAGDDDRSTTAAESPAGEDAAAETPAAAPADGSGAADTAEAPAPSEPAAGSAEPAEQVAYEPLEKVRDDIRKTLATEKANEELERIMGEAAAQLQAEYNAYGTQVAGAKDTGKKPPQPPAKLTDLKWLADQYGLTYEKTAPLTIRELYETAVGKAGDVASQRVSVTQAAYQTLELFEPMLARELEGDWYLVMKIEDTPRRIPEFTEVREQVVQAWKRAEAAKLAEKKAKELAAEVEKSGAPFDQFFFAERGFEVIKPTAFFSWRNYPVGRAGAGTPPGLSEVPELKNVGPEFMEAAFALEGKEAVGLLNFDKSVAYVIRLDRKQYTDEELKQLFLEEESTWPGRIDMTNEHYAIFNNAVEKEILEERAGLEFNEEWLAERAERMQQRQN